MDLTVLDRSFVAVAVLDNLESILWTEKYDEYGEFEIYTKVSLYLLSVLQPHYYLKAPNREKIMVIESVEIITDSDSNDKLKVLGRTLESLLDRRIVLRQIQIDTTLQAGIQAVLNENVISSIYPARNFPNFIFNTSVDPLVTGPLLKAQYYSENVLELITALCKQTSLGFKLLLNSSNQMEFSLYAGKDHSYAQSVNPYVVFSRDFDNLLNSNYMYSKRYKKTYGLVSGDPSAGFPKRAEVGGNHEDGDIGGLYLYEIFIDASDISMYEDITNTPIPDPVYIEQLKQRGYQVLAVNRAFSVFDAEIDLTNSYTYGEDFNLGDIIQILDPYGNTGQVRIGGITISETLSGSSIYPILTAI